LEVTRPRRTWLELHDVQAVLAPAGELRALLATMIPPGCASASSQRSCRRTSTSLAASCESLTRNNPTRACVLSM
jgi:hypothetical protein